MDDDAPSRQLKDYATMGSACHEMADVWLKYDFSSWDALNSCIVSMSTLAYSFEIPDDEFEDYITYLKESWYLQRDLKNE